MSLSSKSSSSDQSDISDILENEKQRIVHKKSEFLCSLEEEGSSEAMTSTSDDILPSRSSIGISMISIPLAWNLDQHFKQKGETRNYTMFVTLQSKMNVIDSKMVTNIDRTMTDVVFPESFVFQNEPDDFCIEICVYSARTDGGLDGGGSIRQRISRSLGRKFGGQVRTQLSVADPRNQMPDCVGNTHFNMVARCLLVLTDAHEECQVHDLRVSAFAELSGPPLYGHILTRMVCLPATVLLPIAQGVLTIRPTHTDTVYQNVRCRLQAGLLRCYVNHDLQMMQSSEHTLLRIILTPGSRVVPCNMVESLILVIEATPEQPIRQYIISCDSEEAAKSWIEAFNRQITDTAIWGEFAYMNTKLTFEKPRDPIETLGRRAGPRLYDTVNIHGTLGKQFASMVPQLKAGAYSSRPVDGRQTAPVKMRNTRTNVKDIFKDVEVSPPPQPPSTRNSRYIINLSVGDGSPLTKVDSSSQFSAHSPSPSSPYLVSNNRQSTYDSSNRSSMISDKSPRLLRHTDSERSVSYEPDHSSKGKNSLSRRSWTRGLGNLLPRKSPTVEITRL